MILFNPFFVIKNLPYLLTMSVKKKYYHSQRDLLETQQRPTCKIIWRSIFLTGDPNWRFVLSLCLKGLLSDMSVSDGL